VRQSRETGVGLPRNYVRPCVLLLLAEGTAHGYELVEQVRDLGLVNADAAGVYRCLRAMDEEGLVRSRWEPSTVGPARRTYVLTAEGARRLAALSGALSQAAAILGGFLDRHAALDHESVR
jgi:PadR family transcriptional regulator PadR